MNYKKSENIELLLEIIKDLLEADTVKIASDTTKLPNRKYTEITIVLEKENNNEI